MMSRKNSIDCSDAPDPCISEACISHEKGKKLRLPFLIWGKRQSIKSRSCVVEGATVVLSAMRKAHCNEKNHRQLLRERYSM